MGSRFENKLERAGFLGNFAGSRPSVRGIRLRFGVQTHENYG